MIDKYEFVKYSVIDLRNKQLCTQNGTTNKVEKSVLFNTKEKAIKEMWRRSRMDKHEDRMKSYFNIVKIKFTTQHLKLSEEHNGTMETNNRL